jgi:hypothetical protein
MVVVVLACVAVAVPAFAYVSRDTRKVVIRSGNGPQFGSAAATCPHGQIVLFGGFTYGVAGMHRTANNQFTVDGFNLRGGPLTVTSFAYCGYGAVPTKATKTIAISSAGTVTATCPPGKVVLAGGFAASRHTVLAVTRLQRIGVNRLLVSAYLRYGISKHGLLTAIAYCGAGPAPQLVSRTQSFSKDGGNVDATCPAGKTLTFGGVIARASGYPPLVFSMAAVSQGTWRARVSTDARVPSTLTSLAYCR